jgi:SAM-dependent methyltransferase
MMAKANHDERAAQLFTRDLKSFLVKEISPPARRMAKALEAEKGGPAKSFQEVHAVLDDLLNYESFRRWFAMKRTAQEMMWDSVVATVDRELSGLTERAAVAAPKGSLTLDPDFKAPPYISRMDTHLMPGGYTVEEGPGSIRQGAVMDAGGAVYQMGRRLGKTNDGAGQAAIAHLRQTHPDLKPRRILDLGTGLGRGAVAAAHAFPEADVFGVDVGASVLRYAHARAEHLGARVHFSQQNAEATNFEGDSFDLIVSSAMFHETSDRSIPRIMQEIHRLLRPGGVTINIEVPHRYWDEDILGKIDIEWETNFNNESSYRSAVSVDYPALLTEIGFSACAVGWRTPPASEDGGSFFPHNPRPVFSFYVISAVK